MAQPVNWDFSHIILQNRAGEAIARGIQQGAQEFSRGIERYYARKKEKEQEDAFLQWAKPRAKELGIPLTGDEAEDEKAIRAGYKAVGPQGLMAFQQWQQAEERQKKQDGINEEMAKVQMRGMGLKNEEAAAMMQSSERINATADQRLTEAAQLGRGVGGGVMQPGAQQQAMEFAGSPAGQLRSQGARLTPEMLAELQRDEMRLGARSAGFSPQEMMTPSGLNMVQTSPRSWIPDPRIREGGKKTPGKAGGPELSKDGKFYRSSAEDSWKPLPKSATGEPLSLMDATDLQVLPGEIAKLEREIEADAKAVRAGDKKKGPDWNPLAKARTERIDEKQKQLREKKARLRKLQSAIGETEGAEEPDPSDEDETAAVRRPAADPFAYVFGDE